MVRQGWVLASVVCWAGSFALAAPAGAQVPDKADAGKAQIERGRYIVKTSGCNDCHTPGYTQAAGRVDEKLWLTGDRLGWRGPWGTTYASNLRLYFDHLSLEEWKEAARTIQPRPPMPWFNLHAMSESDHEAIYRFVRSLGPAGQPAPEALPPGQLPPPPYVQFPE